MTVSLLNDRYRLDRELGEGGMGKVYQGYDQLLDRIVAVKVLSASALNPQGSIRLLEEARAVARLNHPNIVAVFDAGQDGDLPYIVMEYIQGNSLHEKPPENNEQMLEIGIQVCSALDEAHANGIIHRDLKPENVILNESGIAKLTDFGLAKTLSSRMTQEGTLTGTAFYLSPEQALGKPLDGRTDLYSLGVMMYEFSTGELPFTADDTLTVISKHIHEDPVPPGQLTPDIHPSLEGIILKLLAKDPEQRFNTAKEVQQALEKMLRGEAFPRSEKPRHNIPLDLTSFIGRSKEVSEVRQLMTTTRLLTLTGVGGTGKTRLAMQAGRGLLDQFMDGIWVVELSTIMDINQVPRAIAIVLHIREQPDKPIMDMLIDYLRSRQVLLIMDNCEHLISSCARFSEHLLSSCPQLKIMATSRESMGVPGEVTFHVPSLQLPDLDSNPDKDQVWRVESMQLFLERAISANPDFIPDLSQTQAVMKICNRLDGIPLAIELAAARVRALPVEEIAARLSDRFRLLTGGSRSAMPRQQTLQALIDWSHDLLTPDEKKLFRRLSVFAGGWNLASAESVCSTDDLDQAYILELLLHLVDKSLLNTTIRGREARYDMLETIRQYARDRLIQSDEIEKMRDRHLKCYCAFSEKAAPEFWRGQQLEWMDLLETEHDNIRAALEWSLANTSNPEYMDLGMRTATAILRFWMVRGYWVEGLNWITKLIAASEQLNTGNTSRIRLLFSAGFLISEIGDIHTARKYFQEAFDAARALDDQSSSAYALLGLGDIALSEHYMDRAEALLGQSLEIFNRLNDKVGVLLVLSKMGSLAADMQGYEKAKAYYQQNLDICREIGHQLGVAGTLLSLGRIEILDGNKDLGRQYMQESLQIFKRSNDKSGIANALGAIGLSELYSDDLEASRQHYEEVLRINRELHSPSGIGGALIALGEIARSRGDYDAAHNYYEEALQINRDTGQTSIVIIVTHNLGYVAKHQGDFERALKYFRSGLQYANERNYQRLACYCLAGIACVYVEKGDLENAARLFGASLNMAKVKGYHLDSTDQWEIKQCMKKMDEVIDDELRTRLMEEGKRMPFHDTILLAENDHANQ
jgi:predicted ATPase/Tfp pilus assembly protein PilF/predicted Ser/Thr protein kinase